MAYAKKILTAFLIACRAGVILASAQYFLSENYGRLLWFEWQRKAGEREKLVRSGCAKVKIKERVGVPPTASSIFKSNMASWIKNGEIPKVNSPY